MGDRALSGVDAKIVTRIEPGYGSLPEGQLDALVRALELAPLVVALYDQQDNLLYANALYDKHFLRGYRQPITFADVIRHGARSGFGVKISSGNVEEFLESVLTRRRSVPTRAFQTDLIDGTWLWMTETVLDDGHFLSVASEITPLKHTEHALTQARDLATRESLTDALTGLPNRRSTMCVLQSAAERASASGGCLTIALLDLDRFKAINDRFGHDGGDAVLRYFAEYCAQRLAPGYTLGRIGGEEFLLVLPGLNAAHALTFVDWLRQGVPPVRPSGGSATIPYTFSAGLAELAPAGNVADCMRRADEALYRAKAAGRNAAMVQERA